MIAEHTTTFSLINGYDRRKNPQRLTFRALTPAEAVNWPYHQELWFASPDGKARRCRVNGAAKTWKRDPSRVELPIKYGMYERAHACASGDLMVLPTGFPLLVKL
jgi:hypothetical protein